uniref:Uncharacterized protein n=1 Tax=Panagrolaimus superbus TaxID=310955 RepID=A0A914Z5Q5_9BILA
MKDNYDYGKNDNFDKAKTSSTNESTLSLHIANYENSLETYGNDSEGDEEEAALKIKKNEKSDMIKSWKNAKHGLTGAFSEVGVNFTFFGDGSVMTS